MWPQSWGNEMWCQVYFVGLEQERTNLRAAKAGKIEKQSLQHDVNSATQATETIKLRWC